MYIIYIKYMMYISLWKVNGLVLRLFTFFSPANGEKEEEGSESASNDGAQQVAPVAPETVIETTVPKLGQNLW